MGFKIETGENNDTLRAVCKKIKNTDFKKYIKIGKEMVKYIKNSDNGGVGLAAPQIGMKKRLISVSLLKDREDENYSTIMMINPEILDFSKETNIANEGCLSLPGGKGDVKRSNKIKLFYIDERGRDNIVILNMLSARIVQHEVDHLDGILFTDKLVNNT